MLYPMAATKNIETSGQERANYALFLTELCGAIGFPHPESASAAHEINDHVFVREAERTSTSEVDKEAAA
jgi:hypothetical protein